MQFMLQMQTCTAYTSIRKDCRDSGTFRQSGLLSDTCYVKQLMLYSLASMLFRHAQTFQETEF